MNKIHREGVDVRTAFLSGTKRLGHHAPLADPVVSGSDGVTEATSPSTQDRATRVRSLVPKIDIKAALRPIAGLGFRLAKPILRPIAFRLRRYLIDGLRQDLLQE